MPFCCCDAVEACSFEPAQQVLARAGVKASLLFFARHFSFIANALQELEYGGCELVLNAAAPDGVRNLLKWRVR